jgi:hypothetical protein
MTVFSALGILIKSTFMSFHGCCEGGKNWEFASNHQIGHQIGTEASWLSNWQIQRHNFCHPPLAALEAADRAFTLSFVCLLSAFVVARSC